jgi:uncharacterized membrane protein YcaP (DUF421 family)
MVIDQNEILQICLRVAVIYVIVLAGLRVMGKREIAQLSVIDFVLVLLISNAVQNAMLGSDTTLFGGIVAAITLFVINLVLKQVENYGPFRKLLEGNPVLLIYEGKVNAPNLKKSGISMAELEAALRAHGVKHIEEVNLGMLEVNGNISILSNNYTIKTETKQIKQD